MEAINLLKKRKDKESSIINNIELTQNKKLTCVQ